MNPSHRDPCNVLVTGGCGFIGSAFVNTLLRNPDTIHKPSVIVNIDKLDYCSSIKNIDDTYFHNGSVNYHFICGSVADKTLLSKVLCDYRINTVVHFAAQTHVDHSFERSLSYTQDNIVGTHVLLECLRVYGQVTRFIHISTDEVYGDTHVKANENSVLCPTNPYAATKAAAELLVQSYIHSFKLPAIIVRSNNVFGPRQFVEKLIPKFSMCLLNDQQCTIHGSGETVRAFIYVDDVVNAILTILQKGTVGQVYNIGSSFELSVMEVLSHLITEICPDKNLHDVAIYVGDRPYNDKRYFICDQKLKSLGWTQNVSFVEGLQKTIQWYKTHGKSYWNS